MCMSVSSLSLSCGLGGSYCELLLWLSLNSLTCPEATATMAEDEEGSVTFSSTEEELDYWKEKAMEYRDR